MLTVSRNLDMDKVISSSNLEAIFDADLKLQPDKNMNTIQIIIDFFRNHIKAKLLGANTSRIHRPICAISHSSLATILGYTQYPQEKKTETSIRN